MTNLINRLEFNLMDLRLSNSNYGSEDEWESDLLRCHICIEPIRRYTDLHMSPWHIYYSLCKPCRHCQACPQEAQILDRSLVDPQVHDNYIHMSNTLVDQMLGYNVSLHSLAVHIFYLVQYLGLGTNGESEQSLR